MRVTGDGGEVSAAAEKQRRMLPRCNVCSPPQPALRAEYVFHVFQTTSQRAVFCPYSQYSDRIPHVFQNTYSKRPPKMDVFRIKFSSLRVFGS